MQWLLSLVFLAGFMTGPDSPPDSRWAFYTDERTPYSSPWFEGPHRVMIPFGCNDAPYYSPDPRCSGGRGFHHGIDIAMPCGTELYAGRPATVESPASLGPAYGSSPLLLRGDSWDVVIGHTRKLFVAPGDTVEQGQLIALVSDDGAPDGCHLHFERRARGGGLSTAVGPRSVLGLTAVVR